MSQFWQKKMQGNKQCFFIFFCKLSIFSKISQLWKNYGLPIGRRKTEKILKITYTLVNYLKLIIHF